MRPHNEGGIAPTIANFFDIKTFASTCGADYAPNKDLIKLPTLEIKYSAALDAMNTVTGLKTVYDNAVNERYGSYEFLKPLSTRIVNAVLTTDASEKQVDDARGFNRKIQGARAKKIVVPVDPDPDPMKKIHSAAQLSFDQLLQHLQGMISLLKSITSYNPNEVDLKVVTLEALARKMQTDNDAVSVAYYDVSIARIARDKELYDILMGLVTTALEVKKYVLSVYGSKSLQYRRISGLRFPRQKTL